MRPNLWLGALAASQLLASLVLQLLVLRLFGVGAETDAYIAALAIPLVTNAVLGAMLQSAWQAKLAVSAMRPRRWRLIHRTAQGQALLCAMPLALLLAASSSLWLPGLFRSFTAIQLSLAAEMSLPLFIGMIFNTHIALLMTAQRSRGRFYQAEGLSLLGTFLQAGLLFACAHRFGIVTAAWASLARSAGLCAALYLLSGQPLPGLRRGYRAKHQWRQMRSIFAGAALLKLNPLVDRYWSAQSPAGGMTLLNLAQTAISALASVMERAINVPIAPRISKLAAEQDYAEVSRLCTQAVRQVAIAVFVLAAILLLAQPLWTALLSSVLKISPPVAGEFWLFFLLLLGTLHATAAGSVYASAFYALGDTRTPSHLGVFLFLLSAILKSIGFLAAGLSGLVAASSLSYLTNLILMRRLLYRKLKALDVQSKGLPQMRRDSAR